MIVDNPQRPRRRRIPAVVWLLLTVCLVDADAIGISRNPLFGRVIQNYRRYTNPAAYAANHVQQQPQQPYVGPIVGNVGGAQASSAALPVSASVNVETYVSGTNNQDAKVMTESAEGAGTNAATTGAASTNNLVAAPSYTSSSYASGGGGLGGGGGSAYGGGGGGSGGGSYGGAGGGLSGGGGGYGGGAGGSAYGGSGLGGGGAGGYGGGGGGGAGSYGGAGGGGGYGGGGVGGGAGGGYGGAGGLGGGGSAYGAVPQEPSYTVAYPVMSSMPSKGDTLSFLSSLAPSLLLSSLLLPLALALLTNATGVLSGRKKRDVYDEDYDEDAQFSLNLEDFDADIIANDAHFFHTADALTDAHDDSHGEPDKLVEFMKERGLFDPLNPCLEKLACLSATSSKFKGSDKLKKTLKLLGKAKTLDSGTRKRLKHGSTVGSSNDQDCLTQFICQGMKSLKSS